MRHGKVVAGFSGVLLMLVSCGQGQTEVTAGATDPVSPPDFVDCVDVADPAVASVVKDSAAKAGLRPAKYWEGVQCAGLDVPLDYENPDSGTIRINISRVAAVGKDRIGALLTNPGGPGGPGLALPVQLREVVPTGRFDLIGFDPRGVGTSTPLFCLEDLTTLMTVAPTVTDPQVNRERQRIGDRINRACRENSARIYEHLGTADAARDMDRIRRALGEDRLNFIGLSYGSLLGTYYANLFPGKVRALVLDGALSPTLTPRDIQTGGARAAERGLNAFLRDCGRSRGCAFNDGSNLKQRFVRLMSSLTADPIPVVFPAGGRVEVGAAVAYRAVLEGLVQAPASWEALAQALAQAEESDGTGLAHLYATGVGYGTDGSWDTNQEPAYFTIGRASALFSDSLTDFEDLAEHGEMMWPSIVALNAPGVSFDVPADREPGPMPAEGAPPILVMSATRDPSTAHEWGVDLAEQLDSGVLVTRDGDGHTSMLSSTDCFAIAWDYLVDPATAPPRSTGAEC